MSSKKKIKTRIKKLVKEIVADVCDYDANEIYKSDFLDDLELDKGGYRYIRDALNRKYGLSLRKRDIKECIDVKDLIDLVYEELEEVNFLEAEIRLQQQLRQEEYYARQSATASRSSFFEWLSSVGLNWITKTIFNWTWEGIIILFGL